MSCLLFFSLWKYRCSVTEIGWCSIIMSWGKNRSKEEFGNSEKNRGNWIWEIKHWNVAMKSSCSSPKRENWENFKGRGSKMQIPRNERPPNVIKQKNCKPREKTQKKNPPKLKVNSIRSTMAIWDKLSIQNFLYCLWCPNHLSGILLGSIYM